MVNTGSELTFTLSANAGYKVKALTIGDATYSDVTDNTITQKVKIEKETAVSATLEEEASPTPDTGIFTDTQGNKVTIAPLEDYYGEITGYRLTGDIYIEEINSEAFKAKLDTLNGKELYTDSLNINCFTNQNSTITAKEITPELLMGVLTIGEEKKFSALKLNNKTADNSPIEIPFKSDASNYFDITNLAQFSFSENFKLKEGSEVILGGLPAKQKDEYTGNRDKTPYAKVEELIKIIEQEHFKPYYKVKNIGLRGDVKRILPYLTDENFKAKEIDGGIQFPNQRLYECTGDFSTGYKGNGEELTINEVKEISKRFSQDGALLENLTIKDIKDLTQANLNGIMIDSQLENITFKNCDFSKIEMRVVGSTSSITFEDTTLPQAMLNTVFQNLTLKNVTLPQEEFFNNPKYNFTDIPYNMPNIEKSLTISGKVKGSLLQHLTLEQLQELEEAGKPRAMPKSFNGTQEMYDKLKKYIFRGESEKINGMPNPNYHGSIQKQQSQLLALLQNQSKYHG